MSDVQMMCKWCPNDVQMMCKWCPNDVQMMYKRLSFLLMLPCGRPRPWKILILGKKRISFLLMLPCGRPRPWKIVFFVGNKRISFLLMLPCGRPRPWKIAFCCICLTSSRQQNTCIWLDLSIRSMLELLVLKKYAECTSQRLKRTSGARVMIFVFDEHWRTLKKVNLRPRVSNFKKSGPTGVELK